jgi:hypothetical protein
VRTPLSLMVLSVMTHAAAHAGRRRNAGSGTASMALARRGIGTGSMAPARSGIATGSIGTGSIATSGAAPAAPVVAAAAATAATAMRQGDLAGRQMTAKQCDRGSGQRRTNDRASHEPLQSLW